MQKNTIILLLIFSFLFPLCSDNFVKFKYVEIRNDKYIYSKEDLTISDIKLVAQVLSYYNVEYKLKDSAIFIRFEVYKDFEMMYNYSKKSHDPNWLSSHVK